MNNLLKTSDFQRMLGLETVQRQAFLEFFRAAPREFQRAHGIHCEDLGLVTSFGARDFSGFVYNKILGLGLNFEISEGQLDTAVDWLRECCHPIAALQIARDTRAPSLDARLRARGLVTVAQSGAVFCRGSDPAVERSVDTGLDIREVTVDAADDFGRVVQLAFGQPATYRPWPTAAVGGSNLRCYLAFDGQTPIACGVLYTSGAWGWLGFGGTLPEHRGRGAQLAILNRRLEDGLALGVETFSIETAAPAADEPPGPSYRNIVRAGFEVAYVRQNYHLAANAA